MSAIADIRTVMETYYNGCDQKDLTLVTDCFAPDTVVTYHVGSPQELRIEGRQAVMDQLQGVLTNFVSSTHILANIGIKVDGDRAESCTHAIANVWINDKFLVRGLRYLDKFSNDGSAWRIVERKHIQMWQYEAKPVTPGL